MRRILKIVAAARDDIGDLITRRPLPSSRLQPGSPYIDPFLFLNHHGPQTYPKNNNGLPFAPHPHRGFQTVTFILNGDVAHKDSAGHESVIKAGGVQWMSAGSGLVHEEVSSEEFKKTGGNLEILQLWINLPARLKMGKPFYQGLQRDQIPCLDLPNSRGQVHLISGQWEGSSGPFNAPIDIELMWFELKKEARIELMPAKERNVFFYLVKGALKVNDQEIEQFHLVHFDNNAQKIEVQAREDSVLLYGHALAFNEPIVSHGPFVMNSREEIVQAIQDFQAGKFE